MNSAATDGQPLIGTHPTSTSAQPGGTATFTVVVSGEGLTYQWFGPGGVRLVDTPGEISGATSSTLTILNVQSDDIGDYQVRVTNAGGSVDSGVVTLTFGELV